MNFIHIIQQINHNKMKGKQINFYIIDKDVKIIDSVLSECDIKVLTKPVFDKGNIPFFNSIAKAIKSKPIFKLSYLLFVPNTIDNLNIKFVEEQNYYLYERLEAPIIEFSIGLINDEKKTVNRSRLYYVKGYYNDNGDWYEKDEKFIDTAKTVFSETKKALMLKLKKNGDYISPNVEKLINKQGYTLH